MKSDKAANHRVNAELGWIGGEFSGSRNGDRDETVPDVISGERRQPSLSGPQARKAERGSWKEEGGSDGEQRGKNEHEYNEREENEREASICVSELDSLLHIDRYQCPVNLDLEGLLRGVDGGEFWLNQKFLEGLYFVISYIMRRYACKDVKRGWHVNMGSVLLKRRMGQLPSGRYMYRDGIEMLVRLGVIHVNDSYSCGNPEKGRNFCKSYALAHEYCGAEYKTVSFKGRAPRRNAPAPLPENEVAACVASNLSQLRIDADKLREVMQSPRVRRNAAKRLIIEAAVDTINARHFRVNSGRMQARLYHILNECPRELRQAVTLNGKALLETDIPTCQPILMLSILDESIPPGQREGYREALTQDIYGVLGDGRRDKHKKEFLQFAFTLYAKDGIMTWEQFVAHNDGNAFATNFIRRFPSIARGILNYDGSLSRDLQDLEAKICVYGVGAELMRREIFMIPIHDGFLIKPEDYDTVAGLVRREFAERFAFDVELKKKG